MHRPAPLPDPRTPQPRRPGGTSRRAARSSGYPRPILRPGTARSGLAALLLLCGGALSSLHAQVTATTTPLFSLSGGVARTSGAIDETHDSGIHVAATGVFPLVGRLGIEVASSYVRFPADDQVALARLGFDPSTFTRLGGIIDGGARWAGSLTGGIRLVLRARRHAIVPYVSGGGGVGVAGTDDIETLIDRDRQRHPSPQDAEFTTTANFGGGVDVRIAQGVFLFGSGRYMVWFTDGDAIETLPISFGISLRLEPW